MFVMGSAYYALLAAVLVHFVQEGAGIHVQIHKVVTHGEPIEETIFGAGKNGPNVGDLLFHSGLSAEGEHHKGQQIVRYEDKGLAPIYPPLGAKLHKEGLYKIEMHKAKKIEHENNTPHISRITIRTQKCSLETEGMEVVGGAHPTVGDLLTELSKSEYYTKGSSKLANRDPHSNSQQVVEYEHGETRIFPHVNARLIADGHYNIDIEVPGAHEALPPVAEVAPAGQKSHGPRSSSPHSVRSTRARSTSVTSVDKSPSHLDAEAAAVEDGTEVEISPGTPTHTTHERVRTPSVHSVDGEGSLGHSRANSVHSVVGDIAAKKEEVDAGGDETGSTVDNPAHPTEEPSSRSPSIHSLPAEATPDHDAVGEAAAPADEKEAATGGDEVASDLPTHPSDTQSKTHSRSPSVSSAGEGRPSSSIHAGSNAVVSESTGGSPAQSTKGSSPLSSHPNSPILAAGEVNKPLGKDDANEAASVGEGGTGDSASATESTKQPAHEPGVAAAAVEEKVEHVAVEGGGEGEPGAGHPATPTEEKPPSVV